MTASAPCSIRCPSPSPARPWAAASGDEGALVATAASPKRAGQSFADAGRHRDVDDAAPGPGRRRDAGDRKVRLRSARPGRTTPTAGRGSAASSLRLRVPLRADRRRQRSRPAGSWEATSCAATPSTCASGRRAATNRRGAVLDDDVLGAPRRRPRVPGGRRLRRPPLRARRRRRGHGEGRSRLPRAAWAAGPGADAHRVPELRGAGRILADMPLRDHVLQGSRRRPAGDGRRFLALLLDTGVGPLGARQSAWARIKARLPTAPVADLGRPGSRPGRWRSPAIWSTIPRFALVDLETGAATDPGPCVELRRAQRIEQVSAQLVKERRRGSRQRPVRSRATTIPASRKSPEQRRLPRAHGADSGRGHRRRRALPAGPAVRRSPGRPRAGRRPRCGGAGAVARRDRLPVGPAARDLLVRAGRPAQRVLGGGALPAPSRSRSFQHLCFGLGSHGLAASCEPSGC